MRLPHLFVLILAFSAQPASAQEQSWKGELVCGRKPAGEIKFGDTIDGKQVYFPFRGIYQITVRDDRDGWLRVFDGHTEGWADKNDFILSRDAPAYFAQRVQANANDYFAWFMRGEGWFDRGNYDKALSDFNECVRIDPKAASFNNRGRAWNAKRNYDEAIRDFDEATRLDPKYALAFNNRGLAWRGKNDLDKATRDFEAAIGLDPKYPRPFRNRGLVLLDQKYYDKAMKDFDEAIRLDPDYAWAHIGKAVTLMMTRKKEGSAEFQKVIDLTAGKGKLAAEAVILGHFAARKIGDAKAADHFLTDSVDKLGPAWPLPAVRYLRGEIDESTLLSLANNDDKRTEAYCYLGLANTILGRKDDAKAQFQWVKEHGTPSLIEYTIAMAELEKLEK